MQPSNRLLFVCFLFLFTNLFQLGCGTEEPGGTSTDPGGGDVGDTGFGDTDFFQGSEDQYCKPNSQVCLDPNTLRKCTASGENATATACNCVNNACAVAECYGSGSKCEGGKLVTCSNGVSSEQDCPLGCADNNCVGFQCTPNETDCVGDDLRKCDANGMWVEDRTCDAGTCSKAGCVGTDVICDGTEVKCQSGEEPILLVCSEDGTNWEEQPCNENQRCIPGEGCIDKACNAGETKCYGDEVELHCDGNSEWEEVDVAIEAGRRCGGVKCNISTGVCNPPECGGSPQEDLLHCYVDTEDDDNQILRRCNDKIFVTIEDCTAACLPGIGENAALCEVTPCTPGEDSCHKVEANCQGNRGGGYYCYDYRWFRRTCNSSGFWETGDFCEQRSQSEPPACVEDSNSDDHVCQICYPGATTCSPVEPGILGVCADDGLSVPSDLSNIACSSGECSFGVCSTQVATVVPDTTPANAIKALAKAHYWCYAINFHLQEHATSEGAGGGTVDEADKFCSVIDARTMGDLNIDHDEMFDWLADNMNSGNYTEFLDLNSNLFSLPSDDVLRDWSKVDNFFGAGFWNGAEWYWEDGSPDYWDDGLDRNEHFACLVYETFAAAEVSMESCSNWGWSNPDWEVCLAGCEQYDSLCSEFPDTDSADSIECGLACEADFSNVAGGYNCLKDLGSSDDCAAATVCLQ